MGGQKQFGVKPTRGCCRGLKHRVSFEGLGEMFEGYYADTGTRKFPLVLMGGRAKGLACADPGARTPISATGNCSSMMSDVMSLPGVLITDQT